MATVGVEGVKVKQQTKQYTYIKIINCEASLNIFL